MVRPQRWQVWMVPASTGFACIATWQIGHGFGGLGFGERVTVFR